MSQTSRRRLAVLESIESATTHFIDALDTASPSLRLGTARPMPLVTKSPRETRKLAIVLRILELIHQALVDDVVVTKRDIYYKDPELFKRQAVVDRVVDHLAASFNTTRAALNVSAAAKGLVIGNFSIRRQDGLVWECNEQEPRLIPALDELDVVDAGNIDWVLVVEKEATFSGLVSAGLARQTDLGRGIMITGKGYPDLSTRAFLRRLSISHDRGFTAPDTLALVDHDPDGIAIMSTYKHGSEALSHENSELTVPGLQWSGVKSEDLVCISQDFVPEDSRQTERGLLRLTERDRAKARAMLERGVCSESGVEAAWRRELQSMLMLNMKAEIQLLDERPSGLMGWLKDKLAKYRPVANIEDNTAVASAL